MSKNDRSFSIGLLVILAAVVTCLTISHVTQADEADSEQPTPPQTSVANSADRHPSELSKTESELVNKIFGSRLLEIAAEYRFYGRVDHSIRWSPTACFVPSQHLGRLSASDSKETHGKKLYFLYAKKPKKYLADIQNLPEQLGFGGISDLDALGGNQEEEGVAPLGQVLVKEAWKPVKLDPSKEGKRDTTRAHAWEGENKYYAGDKKGLYIMFKTKPDTPGTDQGWVYGTGSADGQKVTSVGLVVNCMQCHQDAPYDRQIGLSAVSAKGQ